MGQAKARGTYEQRAAQAKTRDEIIASQIRASNNQTAKRALSKLGSRRLVMAMAAAGVLSRG